MFEGTGHRKPHLPSPVSFFLPHTKSRRSAPHSETRFKNARRPLPEFHSPTGNFCHLPLFLVKIIFHEMHLLPRDNIIFYSIDYKKYRKQNVSIMKTRKPSCLIIFLK